jgi:acyl-CoA hydrolase/GNAT superfamily N-acetyltransferase
MEFWKEQYASKIVDAKEAVSHLKNGDRVYLGSLCSEPGVIIDALRSSHLDDIEIIQFMHGRRAESLAKAQPTRFRMKSFFVGGDLTEPSESDYVPLYHSQIPGFFRNRRIPIDVAIVQVSSPDRFGRFSLGLSVDVTLAAIESARVVIAQVNPNIPRTRGDTAIVGDRINFIVVAEDALVELSQDVFGDSAGEIGRYCAELVEDGSILQFGFAGAPRGLTKHLGDRRHLGVHSEIYTDGFMELTEAGIITNETKKLYRGKSLATCCIGSGKLYDFVHDNDLVELYPSDMLLRPGFIGLNDRVTAINLAVEIDLRGQIRQGRSAANHIKGSGGDRDFMRGANLSNGGRSIICLRSISPETGKSALVPAFEPKSAVLMNTGEANFIVTEYGAAYLGGKSIRERTLALIEIAHPDHRDHLMEEARKLGYVGKNQFPFRTVSHELRERVRIDRTFKGDLVGRVRAIKPTDESMMRDLFYHLSERAVYFRYFGRRKSMPHDNLQKYVNVADEDGLSIVITIGPREDRRIIAEARYMFEKDNPFPEVAFMVDEKYHGKGIATFLLNYLTEIAQERGVPGFKADVLLSNLPMQDIFNRVPYVTEKAADIGILSYKWRFDQLKEPVNTGSQRLAAVPSGDEK